MSRPNLTADATDESDYEITVEADREKVFQLRNSVFAGYFDGQYPSTYGEELRALIPSPNDRTESLSFGLSADEAIGVAQAIEYGAAVAARDDRDATARRMEADAREIRAAAKTALGY